ncbi:MAG: hypothetical protein COC06_07915 [Bacteroidales bacterium]|nr:MAG: hypothetical protein COC06_07915 [Bacteroidales bacterium]
MRKIIVVLGLIMLLLACNQSKSKVSRYYKATNWDRNCPRLPLYEPLAMYNGHIDPPKWFLSFNDFQSSKKDEIDYHSIGANISSINHIGVDRGVVYGCIKESTVKIEGYSVGDFVYMNNEGSPSWTSDSTYKHQEGEIVATILDTVNKVVMVPERWYIINTKDTTYKFFFDKKNYQTELKELKVSAHMYNIDSVYNQFVREGILPWFPDSIKAALNK